MKYYVVAEIEIEDQSWVPAYIKNVTRLGYARSTWA